MSRGDPDISSDSDSDDTGTHYAAGDDADDGTWWDAIEILEEKGNKYKVRWDGVNKETGQPWSPTWQYKHDCNAQLVRSWKKKKEMLKKRKKSTAKGRQSKARSSVASAKSKTRSDSVSTAAATRQSRQNAKEPTPSPSARLPSPPRAPTPGPSRAPLSDSRPSKRRPPPRESLDAGETARPRKKRKVVVEVVSSSPPRPTPPPESSHEVIVQKRFGKTAVSKTDLVDEEADTRPTSRKGSLRPEAPSKGKGRAASSAVDGDREQAAAVPLSKTGPPRHLKRSRLSKSGGSSSSRAQTGDTAQSTRPRQTSGDQHDSEKSPSHKRKAQGPSSGSASNPRRREVVDPPSKLNGKAHGAKAAGDSRRSTSTVLAQLEEESESDDEELVNPPFLKALQQARSRSATTPISPQTRNILAQEEEENTQEAANGIPLPASPLAQQNSPPHAQRPLASSASRPDHTNAEAGPSKPSSRATLQGRPSANDTFSREGIVPETQPLAGFDSPDSRDVRASRRDKPAEVHDPPSTPPPQHSSTSRTASSVKAKMKRKRKSTKELRPVPTVSPSVFYPHLPPADDEEIEQFSSPEKDARKRKLTLNVPTQETIEEAEFTQEPMDSFMDWEGGAEPAQDPFSADDDGPALSLGPDLPPPDEDGGPRQAMSAVLATRPGSRQERHAQAAESPEVPVLQELPATSTTQRAEADSQSQLSLNGQIAELNVALEEKDEQLAQLEVQMEELQSRITELEAEKAQAALSHQAELKALQEVSDDKAEQISQLESQLVELQLQLTQQASDAENERERHESRIRQLSETLEERDEQVSQLENALVELQTEIAETAAENERLVAAAAEDPKHAEQLAAAQQRATALEQELTNARARLSKAEEESTALTARLEASTQDWERRFKHTEDDRDMFKSLYSEASTHASRLAAENAALEERATLAEGQVRDGLAMIRGTFEGQAAALRTEAEKWRALCGVLTAKDTRTDDEVRRRAAREPGLQEENARLKAEAELVRADMEKMARVVAQMAEQREDASTQEQDADADADASADEDGDADGEGSPWHGKPFRDMNGRGSASPRVTPRASPSMRETAEEVVFACQHVRDGELCHKTFSTREAVVRHAQKTHYSDIVFPEE